MVVSLQPTTAPTEADAQRTRLYFRYLVYNGAVERYGSGWETPERLARIEEECGVIEEQHFEGAFIMLAGIMAFCRRENIPYGPGRGSVGGCFVAWLMGIHEVDSIEWGLIFERFLNKERVSFPDVDIDVSQKHRQRVLDYITDTYQGNGQIVLQVGAFVRAGARAVIDVVVAAMAQTDPNAHAIATNLKKCLPDGNVTGGVKVPRELSWWLENGHGDREEFRQIAEQAGWLDTLLLLDGMFTHMGRHAAGVVILREEDLPVIPRLDLRNPDNSYQTVTGYDMYALDDLGYLKWDILGLRTLDVLAEAHQFLGGSGATRDLMELWEAHRDDPEIYEMLTEGDTVGVFQMETDGYRRTLRDFKPTCFEHIVQLNALYRPGALDFREVTGTNDDGSPIYGRNMVQVFIDRLHNREPVTFDDERLRPILGPTQGIFLYQEQQMAAAREVGGFTMAQADALRKAIGKKRPEEMAKLVPIWQRGTADLQPVVRDRIWSNIEAAARYSWNRSHAVEYGIITDLCCIFKAKLALPDLNGSPKAAFYAAEINSWEDKKERQANVIAEARQHVEFRPPDANVAEDRFIIQGEYIVFGLNGIKGMGEANRNAILVERLIGGPFTDYLDFCRRLPSVPTNMKKSLIACGAFDTLGADRVQLLSSIPKGNQRYNVTLSCGCISAKLSTPEVGTALKCSKHGNVAVLAAEPIERKRWLVLEHVNDQAKAMIEGKQPKNLPDFTEYEIPSDTEIAAGEMEAMGYYISNVPLAGVTKALGRMVNGVIGGEIAKVSWRVDKNKNPYADITLTTPALTRTRVLMFHGALGTFESLIEKGNQLLFRGNQDGDTMIASGAWRPDDVRHFRKIKLTRGDERQTRDFDGELRTIERLEEEGWHVRCL